MAFALNIIGACPYFLKLAISPAALAEETADSRFAIVYRDMWPNVSGEFAKDRFDKVIFVTAADAMPSPKKQIISLLGKLKRDKNVPPIPHGDKYLRLDEAKKYSARFSGEIRARFVPDRAAFITSSSGTTVGGVVKGCVATNESIISQIFINVNSEVKCSPGDRCMTNFPPSASTSLDCLFIIPLFEGLTTIFDPRVSENDFFNQLTREKPNLVIVTGSMWETFFNTISHQRKKIDLSHSKSWIIGGEGTDVRKCKKWNKIVTESSGEKLACGYGSSELFSAVCREMSFIDTYYSKPIMSVGIPYVGITLGVFGETGNEHKYNQRGKLWIKSNSAMKCYYNKPELTAQTKIDGWIHIGDLAEIDENGFVYIWGRCSDTVKLSDGQEVYLFDIANKIKENECIDDAIVLSIPPENGSFILVAHIVWSKPLNEQEKAVCLTALNKEVEKSFPEGIRIAAYAEHDGMLPFSPTTLKKGKNKMSKQTTGYVQVVDGQCRGFIFEPTGEDSYKIVSDNINDINVIAGIGKHNGNK